MVADARCIRNMDVAAAVLFSFSHTAKSPQPVSCDAENGCKRVQCKNESIPLSVP
jgi:hypothetical protein